MVGARAEGLALRPPEPCQSRPWAGWRQAGGGWGWLRSHRAPPGRSFPSFPVPGFLMPPLPYSSPRTGKEACTSSSSQLWGVDGEPQNLRLGSGKCLRPGSQLPLLALSHGGNVFLIEVFIPWTVTFLPG